MAARFAGAACKALRLRRVLFLVLLQFAAAQGAFGQAQAPLSPRNVAAPRMIPYVEGIANIEKQNTERPTAILPRTDPNDDVVRFPPPAELLGTLPAPPSKTR